MGRSGERVRVRGKVKDSGWTWERKGTKTDLFRSLLVETGRGTGEQ